MRVLSAKGLALFATTVTVTVAGLGSSAWAATPAPSSDAVAVTTSSIAWGACADDSLTAAGAQCGFLSVPLDYSHPHGTKIQLAVSEIKHTVSAAKYQGVMLVNPGGPGGSGLSLVTLGSYVPNGAAAGYDWIGFDPRGVGSSKPAISCDPNYFVGPRPGYIPFTTSVEKTWLDKSKGYADACRKNGPILDHMTTIDSARDMDSIRAALGQKKINYYGFSYGTYLGEVYSSLYPQRVRRMVLDSNVDPRDVWYQANLNQDVAFQKNIDIWFGWVAKYDSVYHLGTTTAAVKARFHAEQVKLKAKPAGGVVGPDEWTDIFLYAGYYQLTWLDLGTAFADWANKGDDTALLAQYKSAETPGDDNGFAVYNAVQCTDVQWPQSWNTWKRDNWKTFAKAPYETWANAWYNAPCLFWPAKAQKPATIDGSEVKSALLIDETLDAATPYPGSLEVRKLYPNSSLIAEPGGTSHADSLFGNACVDDQIADYLATGKLPARVKGNRADTTCAPLPIPDPTAGGTGAAVSGASGSSRARVQPLAVY